MKTKKQRLSLFLILVTIACSSLMFQSISRAIELPAYGYGWFPVVAVGEGGSHWTECIEASPEDYCMPTEITGPWTL